MHRVHTYYRTGELAEHHLQRERFVACKVSQNGLLPQPGSDPFNHIFGDVDGNGNHHQVQFRSHLLQFMPVSFINTVGYMAGTLCKTPVKPAHSPFPAHKQKDRKSTRLNSSHVAISYAV